ncbi:hypothetical protein [Flavobacterium sp. MK4S-17]|uniref:hypothetical protein n=1 Tax=Flavobacterium sp. MK4S-17 TaxID=2543737 RepID=UPI00135A1725|nr:hypothetical protein [Flavobacterium sp. MK4S-17]
MIEIFCYCLASLSFMASGKLVVSCITSEKRTLKPVGLLNLLVSFFLFIIGITFAL